MKGGKMRLMPIVIALGAALLIVKGVAIATDARAQAGQPGLSSTKVDTLKRNLKPADPAADEPSSSSAATVDVLTSLSKRRTELDIRERDITMRENLLAAAAKRAEDKIAQLKTLQANIEKLLGQRDAAEQKQFDQLVKSYSSMKPRDAARIFNALSDDVLVPVASAMKPDVLGAVLAQMQPEQAQKLTVKLANRFKPNQVLALASVPATAGSSTQSPAALSPAASATSTPAIPPASANPPSNAPLTQASGVAPAPPAAKSGTNSAPNK